MKNQQIENDKQFWSKNFDPNNPTSNTTPKHWIGDDHDFKNYCLQLRGEKMVPRPIASEGELIEIMTDKRTEKGADHYTFIYGEEDAEQITHKRNCSEMRTSASEMVRCTTDPIHREDTIEVFKNLCGGITAKLYCAGDRAGS